MLILSACLVKATIQNRRYAYCILWPGLNCGASQSSSSTYIINVVLYFRLTDLESNTSREIIQFHYTTWPDFGVPSSPHAFLEFLYKVRASGGLDSSVGPPVVHCSAGIGRSGTFCLVDSCLVLVSTIN